MSLVFFLAIFGLFFQANIIGQKLFCFRDIGRYYYPSRFFVVESLQKGSFPFWNPYMFCGYPSFASLQQAALYPLSLLYYLFPFFKSFTWFFIAHFLVAGIGLYLLLRWLSVSRFGSICGAICFSFSGYLVSMLNLLTTLSAVAWIPFLLLCFQRFFKTRQFFWLVPVSLVLCLQFLAGQPEIMYLTFFIAGIFAVFQSWSNKELTGVWFGIKGLLISAVLVLTITSVQLFPFLEIVKNSVRETTSAIHNTVWSFHPLECINFLIPSFSGELLAGSSSWFGQAWMRSGYLGIIVLCCTGFSLMSRQQERKYFILLAGVGLSLALGQYLPGLGAVYNYLPGFNLIRYPIKYISIFYFAVAVLVGLGAEECFQVNVWTKSRSKLIALLVLLSGVYIALWRFRLSIFAVLEKYFLASLAPLEKMIFHSKFPKIFTDWLWLLAFLSGFMIVLFLRQKKVITAATGKKIFLVIFAVSLLIGNYGTEPVVEQYFYTVPTGNVQFLQERVSSERIYLTPMSSSAAVKNLTVYPEVDFKEDFYKRQKAILPNLPVVHHFFSLDGYESIKLKNNEHLIHLISSRPLPLVAKYLDLLGVKYLLSFYPVEWKPLVKVRDDYITFYENRNVRERVQFFNQVVYLSQPAEIDHLLDQASFDPSRKLILTVAYNSGPLSLSADNSPSASGRIVYYEGNRVEIQAKTVQDVWLLLADTYYPGWHAQVNDQPALIYQADYMLRAVRLPAGENRIVFSFLPSWFWLELIITLVGLIGLSLYGISQIKRFIHE